MKYSNKYILRISNLRNLSYDKTREILDSVGQAVDKMMSISDAEILLEHKFTNPIETKCALAEYHKRLGWYEMAQWFLHKQKQQNDIEDTMLFSTYKEKDKVNVH